MSSVSGRRILLGISGGIAAYKTPELVRLLQKRGALVRCVATENALRLVAQDTLATLTQGSVDHDVWKTGGPAHTHHIDWAQWADLLVVAPMTANSAAKFAYGLADDALSLAWLSCTCPKLVCPAMNTRMLHAAATQRNLSLLADDGVHVMAPDSGELACGETGEGRMPDPLVIADEIERLLTRKASHPLRILLTMGRTEEAIDDVRVITNRSSGRTGANIAREALFRGHAVTVVAGPCDTPISPLAKVVRVRSALEMHQAALEAWPEHDVAICAAAVADFRPASAASGKIPASRGMDHLDLVANPDILRELCRSKGSRKVVGFALESGDLARGSQKLSAKGADLAVCNDPLLDPAKGGFGAGTVWGWIGPTGESPAPTWMAKSDLAAILLDKLEAL
ncbi:MAG: bifunctional phosphopantothenoylcysteine decarboxylase/phosphopantothenate--cysteine ligase CoaBC [Fibrobacterota bacterium]|nr:bifunctional phosphopantothenoylcysteine decarboxylase/phosphopantothenate--cysteine ligase CoaBC [Fibrobacterota bacterium]QQS04271.1 MAG: bifunctional phosphopantothenoylcysteine decarboxylase/phosphopantothenate--cysteine ligase CoaBC [Fibrobacterota bacterium]